MNHKCFIGMVELIGKLSEGSEVDSKTSLRQYLGMLDSVHALETTTSTFHESESKSEALRSKREEYMDELKDREEYFKDKYGDEWENVMYGTATNLAKKDLGME